MMYELKEYARGWAIEMLCDAANMLWNTRKWVDDSLDYGWESLLDLADKIDRL